MADKEPKPEADDEEAKPKKGGAGFVIVAIAAMAGSFGVSFLTGGGSSSAPAAHVETCEPEEIAPPKNVALANKSLIYVPLPDILTTIGSEPATRFLKMNVTVATNEDSASIVEESKLLIMDAFVSYLRSIELTDFENPSFYGHMREQLSHRSEIILGSEASEGVLITEFLIR